MTSKLVLLASVVGVAYGVATYLPCSEYVRNSGTICFRGINTANTCNPSTFVNYDSCGEKFCCLPVGGGGVGPSTTTCAGYVSSYNVNCPYGANGNTCSLTGSGATYCSQSFCCNNYTPTSTTCAAYVASYGVSCPGGANSNSCSLSGGTYGCTQSYCCNSYTTTTTCNQYAATNGVNCPYGVNNYQCVLNGAGSNRCQYSYCCVNSPATTTLSCSSYVNSMGLQCTSGIQYSTCISGSNQFNRCTTSYCCIGGQTSSLSSGISCPSWISSAGASCPNGVANQNCVPGGTGTNRCSVDTCCNEFSRILTDCYAWTNSGSDCSWPRPSGWERTLQGYTCFKKYDFGVMMDPQNGIGPCSRDACCAMING